MESASDLVEYTYASLGSFTEGFSQENYVGNTQYGKLYRGQMQQGLETLGVIVKIWDSETYVRDAERQLSRWQNEIKLMKDSDVKSHPNVAKLIGSCSEKDRLGVVYELQPIGSGSLRNLILQDDFKWIYRIKVVLGFARLLEFLHDHGLWLHNIDVAHLMVDQNFNPRLVDFSMLVGGDFGGTHYKYEVGSYGYVDPHAYCGGGWSDKTDVFAYGIVLLGVIAKRVFDINDHEHLGSFAEIYVWAWREYRKRTTPKFWPFHKKEKPECRFWGVYKERKSLSLVHESLKSDPFFDGDDGLEITKLAMRCVDRRPERRPTIKDVVCCLQKLNVVKSKGDVLEGEDHP